MAQVQRLGTWQRLLGLPNRTPTVRSVRAAPVLPLGPADGFDAQDTEPGDWAASSVDLLRGADVSEYPDTVSDALLDELFRPALGARGDPASTDDR